MSWRKVRVSGGHFDVLVAGEFLYRPEIHASHYQTRDVGVSENVPSHVLQRCTLHNGFFHDKFKPGTGRNQGSST
jgi:hypothetical protein